RRDLHLVQVHVLGGVQAVADPGGGAEGGGGGQVGDLGRGQRVAGGVRGRRGHAQGQVVVAVAVGVAAAADVGVVVVVRVPGDAYIIGAVAGHLVLEARLGTVAEGVVGQLVAGRVDQPQDRVHRRAAGRHRGDGGPQLAGLGPERVQVHVVVEVQPVADRRGD